MTDSKNNVRRSIGPRRTGEGEPTAGADPLAELTRFMDRDADEASWASRRSARGGEPLPDDTGEMSAPRPVRRHPPVEPIPSFEADGSSEASAEDGVASSEFDEPEFDELGLDEVARASADGRSSELEDEDVEAADADTPADAWSSDQEDAPGDVPESEADAEDPFMQALMQELESDSAPQQDAAPPPRVRPSFAFPAARPQAGGSREASASPFQTRDAPAGAPERPAPSGEAPQKAPAPLPAWRSTPAAAPVIRSRATPVAPPPVQATVPMPPARDDAARLEHARDHAAISSEADGALQQLRSRLSRSSQAGGPPATQGSGPDEAAHPAPTRPATSWTRPSVPSAPVRAGSEDAPRPMEPSTPAPAQEAPERPSFVRGAPAAGSTGQGPGWAQRTEPTVAPAGAEVPADDGASDDEFEDEGTIEVAFDAIDGDGSPDPETAEEPEAEAGWTLDEEDLAKAIALSVGRGDVDDGGVDDDALDDETLAIDEDGDLFHDSDDTRYEGGDSSAIDDIDFEFELMSTAPDATADDFRKPSERLEGVEPLEQFELAPSEIDPQDEELEAFVPSPRQPVDVDEEALADDAAIGEAIDDEAEASADAIDDDGTQVAEDESDAAPARVFPELASRGRRAVPNFRFDLKGTGHAAQADAAAPAKSSGPDFDLPGFGASDPWTAWPAGPTQAVKTGAAAAIPDTGSTVAEQLADALFREKPASAEPPRGLGGRPGFDRSDWPSGPLAADMEPADGVRDDLDEEDGSYSEYDEAYYDEAEPEWEDDHHLLPPTSLGEMDTALGLSDRRRRKIGKPVAAAVLLLLVAGGGYATYSFMSGTEEAADGPPPVIQADADGVKVMADGADQTDGGKTVYDRVGEEPSETGRLVRSQEVPIDPSQTAGADSPISSPLLPKRVRTVVVRPDGSIIPEDELDAAQGQTGALIAPSAPSTATGDEATDVATSPTPIADSAPDTTAGQTGQASGQVDDADTSLPGVNVPTEADAALAGAPADPAAAPALSPIRTSERIATPPNPLPAPRPTASEDTRTVSTSRVSTPPATQQRGPLSLVPDAPGAGTTTATTTSPTLPSPSRPATQQPVGDRVSPAVLAAQNQRANQPQNTQTAAATQATTTAPAPTGDWAVQVSSQRTAEQARAAYQQLQRRFPAVLGSREPSIQAADLGDRGTFYRVRLPAQTREAANQLCADLKAAGGDCFIGRN